MFRLNSFWSITQGAAPPPPTSNGLTYGSNALAVSSGLSFGTKGNTKDSNGLSLKIWRFLCQALQPIQMA